MSNNDKKEKTRLNAKVKSFDNKKISFERKFILNFKAKYDKLKTKQQNRISFETFFFHFAGEYAILGAK